MAKQVKIRVRDIGQCFAHDAVISDATTKEKLHVTDEVSFGMQGAARAKAEDLAAEKGWKVVES